MKNKINFPYESQHQGKSVMAGQTITKSHKDVWLCVY